MMKVLHLDSNHPYLKFGLSELGCENFEDFVSSKEIVMEKLGVFDGVVIRSRFRIDKEFIDAANSLKFIARVGSGLENIDVEYAENNGIKVFGAPEGNSNAVAEHALAMLLGVMNKIVIADSEVRKGLWKREENRGYELDGKVVGLIGYGNNGKAFAKKLRGFEVEVIFYDILNDIADENATQVDLEEIKNRADVLSLHIPETQQTVGMVNKEFIESFQKPFWFVNTARGKQVLTEDLLEALERGNILGAALDVLEYEKSSFESLFEKNNLPDPFKKLINSDKVLLSPHIAGWTHESKKKLAMVIVDKVKMAFFD